MHSKDKQIDSTPEEKLNWMGFLKEPSSARKQDMESVRLIFLFHRLKGESLDLKFRTPSIPRSLVAGYHRNLARTVLCL
jgi:hypothetical protein